MKRLRKQLDSVLVKPAGPDCNLACRYCFYLEKAQLFPDNTVHRMSPAVLEAMIRQVTTRGAASVSFGWQGGEPTLMGVDFFKQAIELQQQYGRGGQTVGNGLQTNGLLIDEKWCRFLREARFLVGLSLDGPEHVHDHYRVSRNGKPTWKRVTDASKRMLDGGVEVNALTVLNDYSARYPREIYEFLKESGLSFMQFIPCLERDAHDPTRVAPFSVSPEQLGAFLCEVFDCWLSDFRDGKPTTNIRWFESVFATYVGLRPPECTLFNECGDYVVVEHNGDVFSCDFFVEDSWRLGNVLDGSLPDMLNSPRQARFGRRKAELPHACQVCDWLSHCHGGCPKERWGHPSGEKLSYFCDAYKLFFSHADSRLHQLAEAWLEEHRPAPPTHAMPAAAAAPVGRVGRNDPCPCGSGEKYKRCCGK
jgi:uncharacterized protein